MPINKTILVLFVSLTMAGCKKTLQVAYPAGSLPDNDVLGKDSSTLAVVTGIYIGMAGPSWIDGPNSIYMELGLAADELDEYYPDPVLLGIYTNALSPGQSYFWNYIYRYIYPCNALINSQGAAASPLRRQAIGEAHFLRAFFLFYATNLYGDIPVPTTTDFRTNNVLVRSRQTAVYDRIIDDLTIARGLLGSEYLDGTGNTTRDRVRPNKWAALALLSRVYLYTGNWSAAQAYADSVIGAGSQYELPADLNQVFLANSPEAIWQIGPVVPQTNTEAAVSFILVGAPTPVQPGAMSLLLVNAFEPGDRRRSSWVGQRNVPATGADGDKIHYYPYKYKVFVSPTPKEYLMVMRLAEQYLIRAEARARQGDLMGAAADLSLLRSRAGLAATAASNQTQLLSAIAHERQVELFTEFGDRWFDLKRTESLDSVMQVVTPLKGGVWHSYDSLFPIPASEIQRNPHLTQNPGY